MYTRLRIAVVATAGAMLVGLWPIAGVADDTRTSEEFFKQHNDAFAAGDVDKLLADYHEDAVIVTQSGTLQGKEQIRGLFEQFIAEFSQPDTSLEWVHQAIEGPVVHIVWKAETPSNVYDFAAETFFLRDGKVSFQTVAAQVQPK